MVEGKLLQFKKRQEPDAYVLMVIKDQHHPAFESFINSLHPREQECIRKSHDTYVNDCYKGRLEDLVLEDAQTWPSNTGMIFTKRSLRGADLSYFEQHGGEIIELTQLMLKTVYVHWNAEEKTMVKRCLKDTGDMLDILEAFIEQSGADPASSMEEHLNSIPPLGRKLVHAPRTLVYRICGLQTIDEKHLISVVPLKGPFCCSKWGDKIRVHYAGNDSDS